MQSVRQVMMIRAVRGQRHGEVRACRLEVMKAGAAGSQGTSLTPVRIKV